MKSSITTTSTALLSLGPSAVLPVIIRTCATRSSLKTSATNDRPLSDGGTKTFAIDSSARLKYSTDVVAAKSTSVKTAPNPFVVAATSVPGLKKRTSVMLLPRDVKSRGVLNVVKITG